MTDPAATVQQRTEGRVRILEITNPPVNALAHAVRSALQSAVLAAEDDSTVAAIVIRGSGSQFVAGADVREFDTEPKPPLLNDVLLRIEACRKPVIAAVRGAALGGGFELALACHYRCAAPDAQFAFPEVKLGLLPGAGGTQRLPLLVGVEKALDLMMSGDVLKADKAQELGIIDRLAAADAIEAAAVEYAKQLVASGRGPSRLGERTIDAGAFTAEFWAAQLRKASDLARGHGPHEHIVRAVQVGVRDGFAAGLAAARRSFEELRVGSPARALRHLFFAERGTRAAASPSAWQRPATKSYSSIPSPMRLRRG
jgi:3-hydroxyacyl-CoA dehydrogenase